MAEFSKMKRNALGAPPSIEEASPNLQAPEIAPAPAALPLQLQLQTPTPAPATPEPVMPRPRRDGRTLRRTNRTLAFATRVSPEFDERLRDIAERDGLKLVELLERSLDAYEQVRKKR